MKTNLLWQSDLGDGNYKNPILFADYSDPDVICVGDTYYMTASSFNYTPGLPILISKDMVNWELKNYAIKNIAYAAFDQPAHAKGIWAPAIRYHNNKFWISYGMPDEGIFIINTEDPLGTWSTPVLLLEGKGYIDPCPFWDEDGQGYIVHGYARSRIGFKSILGIFPINKEATKAIGDDTFIYDGSMTQPTIEGPKVHKLNGWYYIFAPAGGVKTGWQTVLRSRNIYGPYEEKIVMQQGNSPTNGPHQGAWVETPEGSHWFIHFQDRGVYGRITHLQPMTWIDEWPMIGINGNEDHCGEPCMTYKKPNDRQTIATYLEASDDFKDATLGLQWQWLGNHSDDFYSLTAHTGHLRLYALNLSKNAPLALWHSSNVLTQKFVCPHFEAYAQLDFSGLKNHEKAGFGIIGGQYAYLAVSKHKDKYSLSYETSVGEGELRKELIFMSVELDEDVTEIVLRIRLSEERQVVTAKMAYQDSTGVFIDTGFVFEPSDHTWVGSKLALFAINSEETKEPGYVDIDYIKVNAVEDI